MKLIQCKKKHYYDADKFASCPHCAVYDKPAEDTGNRAAEEASDKEAAVSLEEGLAASVRKAMEKQKNDSV